MDEDAIYCTYDAKVTVSDHPEDAMGAAITVMVEKPIYVNDEYSEKDRQVGTKMQQLDLTVSEAFVLIEMLSANLRRVVAEVIG